MQRRQGLLGRFKTAKRGVHKAASCAANNATLCRGDRTGPACRSEQWFRLSRTDRILGGLKALMNLGESAVFAELRAFAMETSRPVKRQQSQKNRVFEIGWTFRIFILSGSANKKN